MWVNRFYCATFPSTEFAAKNLASIYGDFMRKLLATFFLLFPLHTFAVGSTVVPPLYPPMDDETALELATAKINKNLGHNYKFITQRVSFTSSDLGVGKKVILTGVVQHSDRDSLTITEATFRANVYPPDGRVEVEGMHEKPSLDVPQTPFAVTPEKQDVVVTDKDDIGQTSKEVALKFISLAMVDINAPPKISGKNVTYTAYVGTQKCNVTLEKSGGPSPRWMVNNLSCDK